MAILQKTREKAGMAVSIIIALALLSFIIDPQTLETAFNAMSSRNDVGVINGKTISYLDFQQDVDKFTTINEGLILRDVVDEILESILGEIAVLIHKSRIL